MAAYAELAGNLPEHEREHVRELAEDVLFMRGKLEETRKGLAESQVVIPYDNGGGQVGIRANPAFGEFEKLLRCYISTADELHGLLGKAEPPKRPAHVVSIVGNSKWAGNRAANG